MKIRTTYHGLAGTIQSGLQVAIWSAIDDDTYDGADDSKSKMGFGSTEQEAIADLKEQMADAAETSRQDRTDEGPFGVGA